MMKTHKIVDEPTILSKNMFRNKGKLKQVHFFGNIITSSSIPDELFSHNSEPEEIWIRYTKTTKLPTNLLKNLNSLKEVDFSDG